MIHRNSLYMKTLFTSALLGITLSLIITRRKHFDSFIRLNFTFAFMTTVYRWARLYERGGSNEASLLDFLCRCRLVIVRVTAGIVDVPTESLDGHLDDEEEPVDMDWEEDGKESC